MNAATLPGKDNAIAPTLYMAMELSNKQRELVFGDGVKKRRVTVEAGYREQLREAVAKAKEKFHLPEAVPVVSCYEAGRDGLGVSRIFCTIHRKTNPEVRSDAYSVRCGFSERTPGSGIDLKPPFQGGKS